MPPPSGNTRPAFTPIATSTPQRRSRISPGTETHSRLVAPAAENNTAPAAIAPTDLDLLEDFWQYCLPPLSPHKNHKRSTSTRAPAFFDQHLDEGLRLKRVLYLPLLATDLEGVADDALKCYLERHKVLPPVSAPGSLFPDAEARVNAFAAADFNEIMDEPSLQLTYETTISKPCSIVASTLELQLPHWCNGHLLYSRNPETNEARGDGFLKLVEVQPSVETPVPPLSKEYLEAMEDFPILSLFEFKSLYTGTEEVFKAVVAHAEMAHFPWATCGHKERCRYKCRQNSAGRVPDAPIVEWAPMGFDAHEPVCKSIQSPRTHTTPPPSGPLTPVQMKHAAWMIQQVWAELVINDATLACLTSGSRLIVMERCRIESTLSISNILSSSVAGHAKLITGFFIASLRDAKQRSTQLRASRLTSTEPATWRRSVAPDPWADKEPNEIQSEILHQALTLNWLVMNPVPAKATCYPFVAESLYFRISPSMLSGSEPITAPQFGPFFRILPHPRISTSKACIRVMGWQFSGLPTFSKFVYAKSAGEERACARLWHECRVYTYLQKAKVAHIPRVVGFFKHANTERVMDALPFVTLILEHAGTSVADNKLVITTELINECKQALRQIHDANICHGSIDLSHILVRDPEFLHKTSEGQAVLPRVSIIGFGDARWCHNDEEKRSELTDLLEALQDPFKKRRLEDDSIEAKRQRLKLVLRNALVGEEDEEEEEEEEASP